MHSSKIVCIAMIKRKCENGILVFLFISFHLYSKINTTGVDQDWIYMLYVNQYYDHIIKYLSQIQIKTYNLLLAL